MRKSRRYAALLLAVIMTVGLVVPVSADELMKIDATDGVVELQSDGSTDPELNAAPEALNVDDIYGDTNVTESDSLMLTDEISEEKINLPDTVNSDNQDITDPISEASEEDIILKSGEEEENKAEVINEEQIEESGDTTEEKAPGTYEGVEADGEGEKPVKACFKWNNRYSADMEYNCISEAIKGILASIDKVKKEDPFYKDINKKETKIYILLKENVTETDDIVLPKDYKFVEIKTVNDETKKITLKNPSVMVNCDLFMRDVVLIPSKQGVEVKVKVAKDKTVMFGAGTGIDNGKLSFLGTSSSILLYACTFSPIQNITTFGEVVGDFVLEGKMSGVKTLNAFMEIAEGGSAEAIYAAKDSCVVLHKNKDTGAISNFTITGTTTEFDDHDNYFPDWKDTNLPYWNGSVFKKVYTENLLNVAVTDASDDIVPLSSGTVIMHAKDSKKTEFTKDVNIVNKTEGDKSLNAYAYGKEIRAEVGEAVILYEGTSDEGEPIGNYPSLELAFKECKEAGKDYTVLLNQNIKATNLKMPSTKINSLTIMGDKSLFYEEHGLIVPILTLYGTSSLTASYPLVLDHFVLRSYKKDDGKGDFNKTTLNTKSNLTVNGFRCLSNNFTIKGSKNATLRCIGFANTIKGEISGFGTATLGDTGDFSDANPCWLLVGKKFSVNTLIIGHKSSLRQDYGCSVSVQNINYYRNSDISYWYNEENQLKPVEIKGKVESCDETEPNKLIIEVLPDDRDEKLAENTQLLKSKTADLSQFDISKCVPEGGLSYTLWRKGKSDAVLIRAQRLSLLTQEPNKGIPGEGIAAGKLFVELADVAEYIQNAKNNNADYTVLLLDDYNCNGAVKMPKSGTYNSLTIESDNYEEIKQTDIKTSSKRLTFSGDITTTGNFAFRGILMDPCKNAKPAPYNIKVANGTAFSAEKVYFDSCKGIKAKKASVFLENAYEGLLPSLDAKEYIVGNYVSLAYNSVNIGDLKVKHSGRHHILLLAADKNGKLKTNKIQNINIDPNEDTNGIWFGVRDQNDSAYIEIKSGTQIFENFEGELKNVGVCGDNKTAGGKYLHLEKGEGKNIRKVYAVENADK
jgi:hypothetical protein